MKKYINFLPDSEENNKSNIIKILENVNKLNDECE